MGALHKLLCVGIGVVCFANLIHMSGMATPKWVEKRAHVPEDDGGYNPHGGDVEDGDVISFSGLFEKCTPDEYDKSECDDLPFRRVNMKRQVMQVLSYLAMVCGLIGVGAAIVLQVVVFLSDRVSHVTVLVTTTITAVCCIGAAGFILSVLSIFSDRFVKEHMNLAYSFFLCMLALPSYICGTGLIVHASRSIIIANGQPKSGTMTTTTAAATGEASIAYASRDGTVEVNRPLVRVEDETDKDV